MNNEHLIKQSIDKKRKEINTIDKMMELNYQDIQNYYHSKTKINNWVSELTIVSTIAVVSLILSKFNIIATTSIINSLSLLGILNLPIAFTAIAKNKKKKHHLTENDIKKIHEDNVALNKTRNIIIDQINMYEKCLNEEQAKRINNYINENNIENNNQITNNQVKIKTLTKN